MQLFILRPLAAFSIHRKKVPLVIVSDPVLLCIPSSLFPFLSFHFFFLFFPLTYFSFLSRKTFDTFIIENTKILIKLCKQIIVLIEFFFLRLSKIEKWRRMLNNFDSFIFGNPLDRLKYDYKKLRFHQTFCDSLHQNYRFYKFFFKNVKLKKL